MGCVKEISYQSFSARLHQEGSGRRLPLNGSYALTYRCNLKCGQCYAAGDDRRAELTMSQIGAIFDGMAEAGCVWLLLTGGEPLLRPDFADIYLYAKRKGFLITLFTNGTCLTPALADVLKEYPPFYVEITLYGITEATYAAVTGVRGMLERCLEGIRLLLERGIYLKLKTTVTQANVHELWQIKDFVEGHLKREFRFDGLIWRRLNGDTAPYRLRLSPDELVALDARDQKRRQAWDDIFQMAEHVPLSSTVLACGAGRSTFDIDPYGEVRICDMLRTPSLDLRQTPFGKMWSQVQEDAFFDASRPADPRCDACSKYMFCDICPAWTLWRGKEKEDCLDYLCDVAAGRAREFSKRR